jgi:hypothetical protein
MELFNSSTPWENLQSNIQQLTFETLDKINALLWNLELKDLILPSIIWIFWVVWASFVIYVLQRAKEEWWILKALQKIDSEYPKL